MTTASRRRNKKYYQKKRFLQCASGRAGPCPDPHNPAGPAPSVVRSVHASIHPSIRPPMSVVVSPVARRESSDTPGIRRKEAVVKLAELYRSPDFSWAYWYWRKFLEGSQIGDSKAAKAHFSELISRDLGQDWTAAIETFAAVQKEYHWAVTDLDLECIRRAVAEGPMEPGSPEARRIFAEYADHCTEIMENAARAKKTAHRVAALPRTHLFIQICLDTAEDLAWRAFGMLTFTVDLLEAETARAESKFWELTRYSHGLPCPARPRGRADPDRRHRRLPTRGHPRAPADRRPRSVLPLRRAPAHLWAWHRHRHRHRHRRRRRAAARAGSHPAARAGGRARGGDRLLRRAHVHHVRVEVDLRPEEPAVPQLRLAVLSLGKKSLK